MRADRYRVKKDGFLHFLDRQSDIYSMDKKFNSIDDFRLCCRDVEVREFEADSHSFNRSHLCSTS